MTEEIAASATTASVITTATEAAAEAEVREEIQDHARPDRRHKQIVHGLSPQEPMRDSRSVRLIFERDCLHSRALHFVK
jgi:hypothetical protein